MDTPKKVYLASVICFAENGEAITLSTIRFVYKG